MSPTETLPDTPVMRQYQELKSRHPEALLFFRLGDFYELFGSDAQTAAPLCGLVLTARQGIPMCGVPYHSSKTYLAKLLKAGHKVAVAEQMEDPSKTKKLVKRDIIRLITPGTIIEDELLEATSTNFLVAVESDIVGWGAACIDVSTGEFWATQALNDRGNRRLFDLLARVRPAEVLCAPETAAQLRPALPAAVCLTAEPGRPETAAPPDWARESVWANHRLALRAALRCRGYVARTQFHLQELIAPVYREAANEMQLDETALRTLELVDASSGDRRHSLWGLLNRCRTAMGGRKLRHWILHPSTDLAEIELRQNCVEDLFDKPGAREDLGGLLREVSDLPRVVSRLSTRQATPRDLAALRRSLGQLPALERWFKSYELCPGLTTLAAQLQETAAGLSACADYLARALVDDPPARLSDGHFIREGFHAELDELRLLRSDSQSFLARLEAEERQASGIGSLKAGYNSVFGYYFEITNAHKAKVPPRYTRKQTLTNAERYITPELKELENKILGAEEKILRLESRLFEEVRGEVLQRHDAVQRLGALLAELDVFNALAECASLHEFVKPQVDLSHDLEIVDGRHPVLAAVLPAGTFVPNSLTLNARDPQIIVLTGPNMSGKSTYLRQNALIAVLAQMGSFVPAKSARVGIVDKILTRIGAQDALTQGASTFMVEMNETSAILKSATPRSLVILDEVGRGTSTFDGISIAWAVLEHLQSAYAKAAEPEGPRGPRTLFATHYFELTELAHRLDGVANANVEAREWTNAEGRTEVVFLHKISDGPADRSYGIHVAALAGLPPAVLARAREILSSLENESASGRLANSPAQPKGGDPELPLFDDNPVLHALRLLDPEAMTPLEALEAIAALKKKL
ncbi:MAG: DNA mismatch repair protein MutS [Elusimicrobia bacterium]|nr:DNA mismatch repair protein MutS [Elusimicrobiota bacterium]